jgi:hypothetical protein
VGVVDDDFAFLVATAGRLIDQLTDEVAPRAADKRRGAVLAKHIQQTLDAIRMRVERDRLRFASAKSDTARSTLTIQLRLLVSLTWVVHEAMPWLDPPRHQLDLGATFLIDEAALAMIGPPVEVLPIESNDYMYWTLSWPFEDLWDINLKQSMPRETRPVILAYPAREASSALLHGAFAHELGHAAVDHHSLLARVAGPALSSTDYLSALDSIFGTKTDATTVRRKRGVGERLQDWIEELLCDQLALAYLGPSFLFCFAGMVLPVTWNEPQDQHPNATMRVGFLMNTIVVNEWSACVSDPLPDIWAWFEEAAATASTGADQATKLLIKICESAEDEIRRVTAETIGEGAFDAQGYSLVDERLSELLENDILPAQLNSSTAADHRYILFAAWLHVIERHGRSPAAIPKALRERDYQRFIAKALEMSTTLRTWNEVTCDDPA